MIFVVILAPEICLKKFVGHRLHCSKTPRGKERGVQNSVGQRAEAELWSLSYLPRGVFEPSFFDPRSFGVMQPFPHGNLLSGDQINTKIIQKLYFLSFIKVIFVTHCQFRELIKQYDNKSRPKQQPLNSMANMTVTINILEKLSMQSYIT